MQATPETEAQESQGLTEDQAVAELMSRWGKSAEPEKAETADKPAAEEPEEETPAEQPKGDAKPEEEAEETDDADGEIEIDVAGEKFKFPKAIQESIRRVEAKAKEVEAGATRKFQEAADSRKAADIEAQSAKQLLRISQSQSELLADHRMVARRLTQLEAIDANAVDSDALVRLNHEYNQLRAAKDRIEDQYKQNVSAMQEEDAKSFAAKREHCEKVVATRIKGWNAEHAKKLSEYAMGKGVPADTLKGISEPWMVEILDDAAYGAAMRSAKAATFKRVENTPKTLKPGAAGNPNSAAQARVAAATAKVKKSGSLEDAASLLIARMNAKGRKT